MSAKGASGGDPLRSVQLQALARRLQDQPEPVRALLREKVEMALADLAQRLDQAPAPSRNAIKAVPSPTQVAWPLPSPSSGELASAIRFRRAWSRIRAQDSASRASSQRPANAGPLNSHVLMAQSLDLMRALPGDYLRRFVTHAESLLWLEATRAQTSPPPARKTKRQSRQDRAPS